MKTKRVAISLAKPGRRKLSVGEHELVGKVGRKGFAFVGLAEATVAVKCAPTAEQASELRERYPEDVRSTGYVGRYGWDTVTLGGAVPAGELRECSARRTLPPSRSFPKSKRP